MDQLVYVIFFFQEKGSVQINRVYEQLEITGYPLSDYHQTTRLQTSLSFSGHMTYQIANLLLQELPKLP